MWPLPVGSIDLKMKEEVKHWLEFRQFKTKVTKL